MKVRSLNPENTPREADIEHTLKPSRKLSAAPSRQCTLADSACIVMFVMTNGIAENPPLNRMLGDYDIIHGTFFFVCGLDQQRFY